MSSGQMQKLETDSQYAAAVKAGKYTSIGEYVPASFSGPHMKNRKSNVPNMVHGIQADAGADSYLERMSVFGADERIWSG
jgi:hypothetical protein